MSEAKILTSGEVAEIEARANAATKGPWFDIPHPEYGGAYHRVNTRADANYAEFGHVATVSPNDGPFIAHARADIPALCATVRHLLEENERLTNELDQSRQVIRHLQLPPGESEISTNSHLNSYRVRSVDQRRSSLVSITRIRNRQLSAMTARSLSRRLIVKK